MPQFVILTHGLPGFFSVTFSVHFSSRLRDAVTVMEYRIGIQAGTCTFDLKRVKSLYDTVTTDKGEWIYQD